MNERVESDVFGRLRLWHERVWIEAVRQTRKYPDSHKLTDDEWFAVAAEEFAELARAAGPRGRSRRGHDLATERLQLTAVLVRWMVLRDADLSAPGDSP